MNIIVQGKELKITQAIRDYASTQIERKLQKVANHIDTVRVYIEQVGRKEGSADRATITLQVERLGDKDIVITKKTHDIYTGLVDVTDRVARKFQQDKEKKITHTRKLAE